MAATKQMIKKITHQNQTYAIAILHDFNEEGIHFCTPDDFSQQLAFINYSKNHQIPAHVHNPVKRNVSYTLETLVVRKGKIRIDFYTQKKKYFESHIFVTGDVILLKSGGHGITILEKTELIEVKQGPYAGDQDKTRFKSINPKSLKLK